MPIQKTTPDPYGTVDAASYGFNARFTLDLSAGIIGLTALRYRDKASHDAGKRPIDVLTYTISGEDFAAHLAANAAAYASLKAAVESYLLTRPEFAGGQVVD
jgi:hypothetical protein